MHNQWLESLEDSNASAWVLEQSERALGELQSSPHFQKFYDEAVGVTSSLGRLPFQSIVNGYFYDVQTSPKNPMGIWCRCSVLEFQKENPIWETLLDLDQFSKEREDEWNFMHAHHSVSGQRVMLALSHRGKDSRWTREFDLETKAFVPGGFEVPLSKSNVSWFDDDSLLVAGDCLETSNDLGYPKILRLWERHGDEKLVILAAGDDEMSLFSQTRTAGENFVFIARAVSWDHEQVYTLSTEGELRPLHLPHSVEEVQKIGADFVFNIREEFGEFPAGSILSVEIQSAYLETNPQLKAVWLPTDRRSSEWFYKFKNTLIISFRENIFTRFQSLEKWEGQWKAATPSLPENLEISRFHQDEKSEELYLQLESFSTPPSLYHLQNFNLGLKLDLVKSLPHQFSGEYSVQQNWATSADGTQIPYFVVHKKNLALTGENASLLYGYGGFNSSEAPRYSVLTGKLWLEKGGIYVVGNIRGGGEFGPAWHRSARKENKQRSYDDFIAIAEDLIARKVTTPKHLGIMGGSNGGLLVGAVAMQRPELFNAVLCMMPLLDMIRYVELPPGASWMAEYGDPRDPAMREVILKYSPYQNVKAEKKYPKIFFFTSVTDDRVHPSHARKMAAEMLRLNKDCLFYEEASGGHNGGNNHVKALGAALKFSYLWKYLG